MKSGIFYFISLIILSTVLFWFVGSLLKTNDPTIAFFLSMIVSHFILEKNEWVVDAYKESFLGKKTDYSNQDK
ncbi:short-chain dehydrogenase [Bacillus luteolus]|uniref:Short-chain dehydrogenase n=1 Tax=Litchfieldia luteola TaxID=682179 RepID=A0ABR9QNH8_9BACI|nr:short-chain dehydrogenase [Cytobacillus luteolus]MBE4910068.1 short-chain dehydrogenase [Cytobacillus luteolus]MBP1942369.1 hypothetical protein [Cytobacillus luteolus]